MKTYSIAAIAASALLLSVASCKTASKTVNVAGPVEVKTAGQSNAAVHKVIYGEWIAYKVGDQLVTGSNRPYVIFDGENLDKETNLVKAYANDGCNVINGIYTITPGGKMARSSELISTLRLCHDTPYERGVSLALNNVTKFELDKIGEDYLLNMKNDNDSTLMVLRKYDLNFINGSWKVTEINGEKVTTAEPMTLIFDTPEQRIHGSVGCNTMNGKITMNPDRQNSMSFTQMATTRMTCPDIQAESALLKALSEVVTVFPTDNLAGAELKDEAGNTVVTIERIQLR